MLSTEELRARFPSMMPLGKVPPLWTVNGCGTRMVFNRDADTESGTYISTLCLCLIFVPILCLRSYRVGRLKQGWYFYGIEPLSTRARVWNFTFILMLAGIAGSVGLVQYMNSPAYLAHQQMKKAEALVTDHKLAGAAAIYQQLALAHADEADNARDALKSLVMSGTTSAPLADCPKIFVYAARVAHEGGTFTTGELADRGLVLINANKGADPRGGLDLLAILRPMIVDTRPIDQLRLSLLEQEVVKNPADMDAAIQLAGVYEQRQKYVEAKALLMPFKNKLGVTDGARVLGEILAHEGDFDGSYALLGPYVNSQLDAMHAAEKRVDEVFRSLWSDEIQALKDNKAPDSFYQKYKAAAEDQQDAMVQEYVHGHIRGNAAFAAAQAELEKKSGIVPVALDLGMVMLQRAQAMPDPAARTAQLQDAEKTFLAIRSAAGESDQYRLNLGEVYYWLGKQDDGKKLFDEFLDSKGRNEKALMQIAICLRDVGAVNDARAMAEEAFAKATTNEDKYHAAGIRAVLGKDVEDEILWLGRCNTLDPMTRARLANAVGLKAYNEGHDDEAARQYHDAIAAYAAMPRSDLSLNNAALAYFSLYQVTGDHADMARGIDFFQQAVALAPSDPVLLSNAAYSLQVAALTDVIGPAIDLRALKQSASYSLLSFLYSDAASRAEIVKRLREHPGMIRAVALQQKVMVLSPKSPLAYNALLEYATFTRDVPLLQSLQQRVESADVDTGDELTAINESIHRTHADQLKTNLQASAKRFEALVSALRTTNSRSAAVALSQQADVLMMLDSYTREVDPEKLVAMAREVGVLYPSGHARFLLQRALAFRAAKQLCAADATFDATCKKFECFVGSYYLLTLAGTEPGALQAKVAALPDMPEVAKMLEQEALDYGGLEINDWAFLKITAPADADKIAAGIRDNPRHALNQSIQSRLSPANVDVALLDYWLAQILKTPNPKSSLQKVSALGIPVPIIP